MHRNALCRFAVILTKGLFGVSKSTLHSGNLYQIFSYVKNKEAELAGRRTRSLPMQALSIRGNSQEEIGRAVHAWGRNRLNREMVERIKGLLE